MDVREQAVMDIQEELSRQGKSFIAFHNELDEVMEEIAEKQDRIRRRYVDRTFRSLEILESVLN